MTGAGMKVGLVRTEARYPSPPFHPSARYPEYPFSDAETSDHPNPVYDAVRQSLALLGLDAENYGKPGWNPLGQLIREGSRVIIKPNFVNHYNPLSDERVYFEALVTQAAVMRPLVDYVLIATRGHCTLTFADLPIQSADTDLLCQETGLNDLIAFIAEKSHGNARVQFLDLRDYQLLTDRSGAVLGRVELSGDPQGYVTVDLGKHSRLVEIDRHAHLYRAPDYFGKETVRMHTEGRHQYILPRTILESDLFINVPKLKVHRKCGATLCQKNLVGIIGDKACLPHWRAGSPKTGGDEYPVETAVHALRSRYDFALRRRGKLVWRLARQIGRPLLRLNRRLNRGKLLSHNGDWYGNDTIWRMVHDLNRIIFHADSEGVLHDTPQRHYLAVVDGIVGGEGEGPLKPTPVPSGLILAGTDPLAVDLACVRLMGLDWRKIPLFTRYDSAERYPFSAFQGDPDRIELTSSDPACSRPLSCIQPVHYFQPASGWMGQIELGNVSGPEPENR